MMGERPADLGEFARLGDTAVAGSSTGWTDEKHMLYISLLEESFVSQLYDGGLNLKGLFGQRYPRVWKHKTTTKKSDRSTKVDQEYRRMIEVDRAKSRISWAEHIRPPSCCEDHEDGKAYCMDDNASTTEPIQARTSCHTRGRKSGGSSAWHFNDHRHSLSRGTELSDQNFVDEQTEGSGESSRGCSKKRLRYADDTTNDLVPSVKASSLQEVCHDVQEDDEDCSGSSSESDINRPASSSCKVERPKR